MYLPPPRPRKFVAYRVHTVVLLMHYLSKDICSTLYGFMYFSLMCLVVFSCIVSTKHTFEMTLQSAQDVLPFLWAMESHEPLEPAHPRLPRASSRRKPCHVP